MLVNLSLTQAKLAFGSYIELSIAGNVYHSNKGIVTLRSLDELYSFLESFKIDEHIGYSYGAEKAGCYIEPENTLSDEVRDSIIDSMKENTALAREIYLRKLPKIASKIDQFIKKYSDIITWLEEYHGQSESTYSLAFQMNVQDLVGSFSDPNYYVEIPNFPDLRIDFRSILNNLIKSDNLHKWEEMTTSLVEGDIPCARDEVFPQVKFLNPTKSVEIAITEEIQRQFKSTRHNGVPDIGGDFFMALDNRHKIVAFGTKVAKLCLSVGINQSVNPSVGSSYVLSEICLENDICLNDVVEFCDRNIISSILGSGSDIDDVQRQVVRALDTKKKEACQSIGELRTISTEPV